ncbi:hypothetical protein YPPY95_2522, partial [Yersinia pestis PY-95]
MFTGSPP